MILCYEIEKDHYCFCKNSGGLSQKTLCNSVLFLKILGMPLRSKTKIAFKLILHCRLCLLERAESLLVVMGLDKVVRPLETIDE